MLKRVGGSLPSFLVVIVVAVAAVAMTQTRSYRDCARAYPAGEAAGDLSRDLALFAACEGRFLQENAAVLTAIALLLIAFVALALHRSTTRLWMAGERHVTLAEKAVETARLGAEAAMGAERAHLFVSVKATNLERPLERARAQAGPEPDVATPLDPPSIDYVLSNYGRTLALLKDVKHVLVWESPEGLRSYQPGQFGPLEIIAPHAEGKVMRCSFRGDFTSREAQSLVAGSRALSFFGEAVFLDVFGRLRGVKWQCRCAGGSFDLIALQEFEPQRDAATVPST